MMFDVLMKYYSGFELQDNAGNNAFDFSPNRTLAVSPCRIGGFEDLSVSTKAAFREEGKEFPGLNLFVLTKFNQIPVFIFDNHNHAFFFWCVCLNEGVIPKGLPLVHVDQHKDMREPDKFFSYSDLPIPLDQAFDYTQNVLNVGNFIPPALKAGFFSEVIMMDHQEAFEKPYSDPHVLDLDIDVFTDEMNYISKDLKIQVIRQLMKQAQIITVATSPYFINQNRAIEIIKELFS